jgi:hypothetical protein
MKSQKALLSLMVIAACTSSYATNEHIGVQAKPEGGNNPVVRRPVVCDDEKARLFHAQWEDQLRRANPDRVLGLTTSDYRNAYAHMKAGVSPWITYAEEKGVTNYVVPGGKFNFGLGAGWVNPQQEGTATVSVAVTKPAWPVLSSYSTKGWWMTTERKPMHFISQDVWLAVPASLQAGAKMELLATAEASGPSTESGAGNFTVSNTYIVVVVKAPPLDPQSVLTLWAYAISEGWDATEAGSYPSQRGQTEKVLLWIDELLRAFREKTTDAGKAFLDRLLSHPKYQKRVVANLNGAEEKK